MMSPENTTLPPGWEAKIDKKTGKTYYINHYEKTSTWDHPCNPKRQNLHKATGYPKNTTAEYIGLQDFSSKTRGSPSPLIARPNNQESSLSSNSVNVDEAVLKIGAMFPTVSDAHIRLLMKNCRYMKSIFPKAEETLILEILSNHDNNIQKSSEKLQEMGFEKKDSLKISQQKYEIQSKVVENIELPKSPVPIPKMKTADEKTKLKSELSNEYPNIPEQLITMALESVDFDKEKANNLIKGISLEKSKTEEGKIVESSNVENQALDDKVENSIPPSVSRQSLKSLLKSERTEKEIIKNYRSLNSDGSGYRSKNLSNVLGPNPNLAKGNKENLLLEEYVKWLGPDPNHCKGANPSLAKGPNSSYQKEKTVNANGPNSENRRGPNKSLIKGSIVDQMKATVTVGDESRGK